MLFQQTQLSFERSNGSPLLSKKPFSRDSSVGLDLPKLQRASTPIKNEAKKSYKIFTYDSADIIAPAPKKPHHCGDQNMYKRGPTRVSSLWSLSTLDEDSDEDTFETDLKTRLPEWNAENDAYAELLRIVNNASPKSFQSKQEPPSEYTIERRHPVRTIQPISIEENGIRLDDAAHSVQDYGQFFGQSPICRTQNPLPLDSMFSPKGTSPEIPMIHPRNDLPAMSKGSVGDIKSAAGLIGANQQTLPLPFSFHKIHLRPRSLSVGARSGQAGISL